MNIAKDNYSPVNKRHVRERRRVNKYAFISLASLKSAFFWSLCISVLWGLSIDGARAQEADDLVTRNTTYDSPERFALELKIGPYVPDVDDEAFEDIYHDDSGLMLGLELEVIAFRLKDILYLNGGAGIGYADYTGPAREVGTDEETGEEADFDIVPLSLKGVLRIDALARLLDIPFIFTGKLGYAWFIWDDEKGNQDIADGISHGLVWAGQLALDLDFFDRAAARMLDDEWGINHSFLFFEVYGVDTREGLELDETTWSAGLGFIM
jgi:hypothetical protein